MNHNIISLNKNLSKLKALYKERKYSKYNLSLILDDITLSISNKHKIVQIGGYDIVKLLENIREFRKKIGIVGSKDFKDFIETLEEFIDIFKSTP
jgi:hypothetical protein